MALSQLPLSYCTNVHPSNSLADVCQIVSHDAARLRQSLGQPMGIGLWLNRSTIDCLNLSRNVAELRDRIRDSNLACYTMNAFPFGDFHARRVKDEVYRPDWTSPDRTAYTCRVADILAALLPEFADGSISTLPCAFKHHVAAYDPRAYYPQLILTARHFAKIRQQTGRIIRLAIEPEPFCCLETTDEAIAFFVGLRDFVAHSSDSSAVEEHIGLCYDVCHQAVEFEDVINSLRRIDAAGIRVNKVHITCALELREPASDACREHLARFVEERYLHQAFARNPFGRLFSVPDCTLELTSHPPAEWLDCPIWRIHFHVPVHEDRLGPLYTTRPLLLDALHQIARLEYAPHLEVETYTWNVLPASMHSSQTKDLVRGLHAELAATRTSLDKIDRENAL